MTRYPLNPFGHFSTQWPHRNWYIWREMFAHKLKSVYFVCVLCRFSFIGRVDLRLQNEWDFNHKVLFQHYL